MSSISEAISLGIELVVEIFVAVLFVKASFVIFASVLLAVHHIQKLHRDDQPDWYHVGRGFAHLEWIVHEVARTRQPVAVLVALLMFIFLEGVMREVGELTSGSSSHSGNPPPELSPVKKMQLQMSTEYPFKRDTQKWPDFFGHKFPLGESR